MKAPTKKELLSELRRITAENERLARLVTSQRPELYQLRNVEVALRHYLNNSAPNLARLHAEVKALLPGEDDLPSFAEMHGIFGDGKERVDAAIANSSDCKKSV